MNTNFTFQNSEVFIATFFSHFGAIRFKKQCEKMNITASLIPAPRKLSASCGTGIRYEGINAKPFDKWPEEVEAVFRVVENGNEYEALYFAEDD